MNESYRYGLIFTQAHAAVRGRIYSVLSRYELTPTYWSILSAAYNADEGIRLTNVAKQIGVKAPLVTMLANDLINQELIVRVPHHTDGRAKLLVTTAKGKKVANEVEKILSEEISALMSGTSPNDAKAFEKTLKTILKNAQMVKDGD